VAKFGGPVQCHRLRMTWAIVVRYTFDVVLFHPQGCCNLVFSL
jgi:hypothetical protein